MTTNAPETMAKHEKEIHTQKKKKEKKKGNQYKKKKKK